MQVVGVEPTRTCVQRILSPSRIPIPTYLLLKTNTFYFFFILHIYYNIYFLKNQVVIFLINLLAKN